MKTLLYNFYKNVEIKEHRLLYLFFEITRKCCLDCLHCGSDCKNDSIYPEIDTDGWLKIVAYIKENFEQPPFIAITGGEPLMRKDLALIGKALTSNNVGWGIVTNGFLLDNDRMEELIDSGIKSMTISLDGDEESHNFLRNNRHSYEKALNSIKIAASSGLNMFDVVTCVFQNNLDKLDIIANILLESGVKYWRLFRIFPIGRAKNNEKLRLDYNNTWKMINWIKDNKKKYKAKGLTINLSCEGYLPMQMDLKVRDTPFFCRAGINIASILSDGTITGCSNNGESFFEGNITKDDLLFVWRNRFKNFRDKSWLKDKICEDCRHLKNCRGSSIHLWDMKNKSPYFCYLKEDIFP